MAVCMMFRSFDYLFTYLILSGVDVFHFCTGARQARLGVWIVRKWDHYRKRHVFNFVYIIHPIIPNY